MCSKVNQYQAIQKATLNHSVLSLQMYKNIRYTIVYKNPPGLRTNSSKDAYLGLKSDINSSDAVRLYASDSILGGFLNYYYFRIIIQLDNTCPQAYILLYHAYSKILC